MHDLREPYSSIYSWKASLLASVRSYLIFAPNCEYQKYGGCSKALCIGLTPPLARRLNSALIWRSFIFSSTRSCLRFLASTPPTRAPTKVRPCMRWANKKQEFLHLYFWRLRGDLPLHLKQFLKSYTMPPFQLTLTCRLVHSLKFLKRCCILHRGLAAVSVHAAI